tara:strand:- start:519 stop:1301 length:783 start_codon:yes stop_codon:yes gene_type:complete
MKSLIKKLAQTNTGILLRNSINFRPIVFKKPLNANYPITVSDAFLWRTDNGFKTKFKYSDILNLFYKIDNSWVEFHFYSKKNELIKIEKVFDLHLSNEIEISSKYLNNIEDYGTFYIYHFSNKNINSLSNNDIIVNRCYLGYSKNNNLHSYVHGNTLGKFTDIYSEKNILSDIVKMSLFLNHTYTIQKYFDNIDKNELLFTNPTSKIIKFSIESNTFKLKPNFTMLIETKNPIITIKSNCLFFRPTIFTYKENYLDVHHS